MNFALSFLVGCLACGAVRAESFASQKPMQIALNSGGGFLVRSTFAQGASEPGRVMKSSMTKSDVRESPLAAAIGRAAKKDFIDEGVEATRNMLIECQNETSTVLVTPSLRSNSQRDHCFRF